MSAEPIPLGNKKSHRVPDRPEPSPAPGLSRRELLAAWAAGGVLAGRPALAQNQAPQAIIQQVLGDGQRFDPGSVTEVARQLARRPYQAPPSDLPDVFSNLNYEQYVGIRNVPGSAIWGDGRGISVEPLHRGFVFANQVQIFVVEDGAIRRIPYDRARFEYGKLNPPVNLPDIGFSGLRLLAPFGNGTPVDFAIIQGATFFRALARGQNFGVVARALTLKPAETRGEEFPVFRAFWVERPQPGSLTITIHGILDSDSTSGAVRMTFRPGEATIVDVEMTLFPRVNLEHVGFGGMTSTYLFGPNDRRNVDDARVSVFESSGLQMWNGSGEWLWRPLHNPETLQISAFVDTGPKGFGLVQRERSYEAFQDDDQRFERRPTLWIEPLGDWGQGTVQLLEIPSDAEINDNILAYWRPKTPIPANGEFAIAYRQHWCWAPPERPPLATVTSTRIGRGLSGRRRRFFVDFSGDMLAGSLPEDLKPALTVGPGSIQFLKVWPYPERKTLRVSFDLDPGNDNASEMRLVLVAGGKPISETWLYRWTP